MQEPNIKRAVAFIDGQNLFHAAKEAFGYKYPNYDVLTLSLAVCRENNWELAQTRFYTGIPDKSDDEQWHGFWTNKLLSMARSGVVSFTRRLRYRNHAVKSPDGRDTAVLVGVEKGIDVRIALDIVRLAHKKEYDVALVFSQDQDLSEAADEIRSIAKEQDRWIKIASAFPLSPVCSNKRGINNTAWIKISRELYDRCIDKRDYRIKA